MSLERRSVDGPAPPIPSVSERPGEDPTQLLGALGSTRHWRRWARGIDGKAYRDFARDYPDEDPGSYRFGAGGTEIGGLALARLKEATTDLQAVLEHEMANPRMDWTLR